MATTLLPALEPLVDQAVAWLQNTENQQEVIDKVTRAIKTLCNAIAGMADFGRRIAASSAAGRTQSR